MSTCFVRCPIAVFFAMKIAPVLSSFRILGRIGGPLKISVNRETTNLISVAAMLMATNSDSVDESVTPDCVFDCQETKHPPMVTRYPETLFLSPLSDAKSESTKATTLLSFGALIFRPWKLLPFR